MTVNHSQTVTCPTNSACPLCVIKLLKKYSVVITLPTSTTNITGFFATKRGSNFVIASPAARFNICGSNSDFD